MGPGNVAVIADLQGFFAYFTISSTIKDLVHTAEQTIENDVIVEVDTKANKTSIQGEIKEYETKCSNS